MSDDATNRLIPISKPLSRAEVEKIRAENGGKLKVIIAIELPKLISFGDTNALSDFCESQILARGSINNIVYRIVGHQDTAENRPSCVLIEVVASTVRFCE